MNKKRIHLSKETLEDLYLKKLKNPHEMAEILNCNHKTIRKNLKEFNIPLRTIREYNALSHKTYSEPDDALLFSKQSLILHSIYKCEGESSSKCTNLCFVNQDPNLILTFYKGMIDIYQYQTEMKFNILYNYECTESKIIAEQYSLSLGKNNTHYVKASYNKRPIIKVKAGGQHLFNLFMNNTKKIFDMVTI